MVAMTPEALRALLCGQESSSGAGSLPNRRRPILLTCTAGPKSCVAWDFLTGESSVVVFPHAPNKHTRKLLAIVCAQLHVPKSPSVCSPTRSLIPSHSSFLPSLAPLPLHIFLPRLSSASLSVPPHLFTYLSLSCYPLIHSAATLAGDRAGRRGRLRHRRRHTGLGRARLPHRPCAAGPAIAGPGPLLRAGPGPYCGPGLGLPGYGGVGECARL
jgi:hypothetical protein